MSQDFEIVPLTLHDTKTVIVKQVIQILSKTN